MSDYYDQWRRKGPGILQFTRSYRTRAPKGSVAMSQTAISREGTLELHGSNPYAKRQLYSDLYAEAGNGETYNSEDTGHEFITQTFKCQRIEDLPLTDEKGHRLYLGRRDSSKTGAPVFPAQWVCVAPEFGGCITDQYSKCRPQFSYFDRDIWKSIANSIQDVIWAQCPDTIHGSLGQDAVDVLALGKQLNKLLTLQSKGISLKKQYSHFSAKKKAKIDDAVASWRQSPGRSIGDLSRHASGEYLTWLFQYLPWVDDLQTLLGAASETYLRARGRTRRRTIRRLGKIENQFGRTHRYWGQVFFHPQFDRALTVSPSLQDLKDHGYWCGRGNSFIPTQSVNYKLTASVVSVWTQNFEHGALEPLYELNKKLGLVYPSLIWDLIPWSWLVDWFTNVGKFIDRAWMRTYGEWNCSYAYVTTKIVATYANMTYIQTCRTHASPQLGIGAMSANQLSSSQWSILTALGLSHRK